MEGHERVELCSTKRTFAQNLARPDTCKDRLGGSVLVTQVACNQDVPRTIRMGKNSVRFGFKAQALERPTRFLDRSVMSTLVFLVQFQRRSFRGFKCWLVADTNSAAARVLYSRSNAP